MPYYHLRDCLESLIGKLIRPEENGTENVYLCPFCDDKSGHFYVNYHKGLYICFRCNKMGSILEYMRRKGVDVEVEAGDTPLTVDWADEIMAKLQSMDNASVTKKNVRLLPMKEEDIPPTVLLNEECLMYLYYRGFTLEMARQYGLRAIDKGPYSRVFIPCIMHGKVVFWQGRAIHPKMKPKYWQPPVSKKSEVLFNYDIAAQYDHVVICEGAFSAMRVGECAVALFGKSCSPTQMDLLCDMDKKHYFVALDGDAISYALNLMKALIGRGKRASVIAIPKGHDPDTYPIEDAPVLKNEYDVLRYRVRCI